MHEINDLLQEVTKEYLRGPWANWRILEKLILIAQFGTIWAAAYDMRHIILQAVIYLMQFGLLLSLR